MSEGFTIFRIYVDEAGDFHYSASREDNGPVIGLGYYVGKVEREGPSSLYTLHKWVAEECPTSKFPSVLTEEEIGEVREMAYENL